MHETLPLLEATDFPQIRRNHLTTLQVNLGYLCNQSCVHCHVAAGPNRLEMMSSKNIELILEVLKKRNIQALDLTGGAPEMHQDFQYLVRKAKAIGVHVIDRCNLTILFEKGYEDLAEFLADQQVEIIASLPCYSSENVDKQRGSGVFDLSIKGLQKLNALGYGLENHSPKNKNLDLSLVYNPQGPVLPPPQKILEADYKRELKKHFNIEFTRLLTIANMPIKRFGSMLISKGMFEDYLNLLKHNYSEANLNGVMCRNLVSVDWQGYLYDCDFNQQLGLERSRQGNKSHLRDLLTDNIEGQDINVAEHCYGCTAGQGSSCGGALRNKES